jgi:hypothetical protein
MAMNRSWRSAMISLSIFMGILFFVGLAAMEPLPEATIIRSDIEQANLAVAQLRTEGRCTEKDCWTQPEVKHFVDQVCELQGKLDYWSPGTASKADAFLRRVAQERDDETTAEHVCGKK